MQSLINKRKVIFAGKNNPVCKRVCFQLNAIIFKGSGLTFKRGMTGVFGSDDCRDKGRRCNTVAKEIGRPVGSYDRAIVLFGSINVHMMLICKECSWDNGQTFINFFREFLISIWEKCSQFFFGKDMIINSGWQTLKLILTAGLDLTCMSGNSYFGNVRFPGVIRISFCFIKEVKIQIKETKLILVRGFSDLRPKVR